MNHPLYLDYAATTPVDPRVAERMTACLTQTGNFGNAASRQHAYGRQAHTAVEQARAQVAGLIGAEPAEIIWTSGATESNNLALKGVAEACADRGRHVISMKTEHKSVVDSLRDLTRRGWRVTWLAPDAEGRLPLDALEQAICDDTVLVSVMMVNNETGVVQDIAAISDMLRPRGVWLHVDAVQAVGKLPVDVEALGVDLLSLSAHKLYGPKGIGALYVRRRPRVRVAEQMHGGGHERGMRSGTLPVHQIVGLGEACVMASECLRDESTRITRLRDQLWAGLASLEGLYRNGSAEHCVGSILNVSVAGVDGEALHAALAGLATPLAISSGSACTAASQESSYVLRALGRDDELAYASLRFSLGRWTTEAEVDAAIHSTVAVIQALRACNPEWQGAVSEAGLELADTHPDYSAAVWRYFARALTGPRPGALEGVARVQTPGSRAVLTVHTDATGRLWARAYGCVSTLAVTAWLTEALAGSSAAVLSAEQVAEALQLSAVKRHCALMAEDALQQLGRIPNQNSEAAGWVAS